MMRHYLFIIPLFIVCFASLAQMPDYISLRKKSGRLVKDYYKGAFITFRTTKDKFYAGEIGQIKDDSIYLKTYQIDKQPTVWGTTFDDTIHKSLTPFYYKEVHIVINPTIERNPRLKGRWLTWWLAKRLKVASAGYIILDVINGLYLGYNITDKNGLTGLGTALGLFVTGFILDKALDSQRYYSKNLKLLYIKMN
jgi:hypothetical protein